MPDGHDILYTHTLSVTTAKPSNQFCIHYASSQLSFRTRMDPLPVEEPYDEALDDSIAPLKRNHACLQCKKRKVKCDGVSLERFHG
jgi:hypothetical protein